MPDIYVSSSQAKPKKKTSQKKRLAKKPILKEIQRIKKERIVHPLASFIASPRKWRFETQEKGEKIILLLRRHWLTNVGWLLGAVVLLILPQFIFLLFSFGALPLRFKLIGTLIWYLVWGGFVFERFLNWFFNVFIITDERIVDFDFYGLIYKEISDAKIEHIQDVTYRVGGFLRNLFDFGSVFVQTAAQVPQFEFHDVPQPARVAKVLRELITEEEIEKIEGRVR